MTPSGMITGERPFSLKWLLTGVANGIDLHRMSTGERRDFPAGVSGSHTALEEQTCYLEVPFKTPPPHSYMLSFTGTLKYADCTKEPNVDFSGTFYDADHGFSQQVFITNSGEYAALGLDGILRYSYPAFQTGSLQEVVALFPSARPKLTLTSIAPLGDSSPPVPVLLFGQDKPVSSEVFYK
jgi:hypothetical protein